MSLYYYRESWKSSFLSNNKYNDVSPIRSSPGRGVYIEQSNPDTGKSPSTWNPTKDLVQQWAITRLTQQYFDAKKAYKNCTEPTPHRNRFPAIELHMDRLTQTGSDGLRSPTGGE